MDKAKVAIIIPSSRPSNIDKLKEQFKNQSIKDLEMQFISGYKKATVARNLGVNKTSADILVFLDDDVNIQQKEWLENLIMPLIKTEANIGLCGCSFLISPDANWFERRLAYEYSRFEAPLVTKITESDLAGSVCAAMTRKVFNEIGGWNEELITGTDIDLRKRLLKKGYKILLSPNCWVYHERPRNIIELLRKMRWYYFNSPLMLKNAQKKINNKIKLIAFASRYLLLSLLWAIPSIFIQHDEGFRIKFTPFKAIANTYGRLCYFVGLFYFYSKIKG